MDDELLDLLTSTVGVLGLELVDAEVRAGLVRVVVDRKGDAADLDAIADATRAISAVLDDHDPQPGRRYTLEVSSPGVERPLRAPQHFARAVGEIVTVRTVVGAQGERRVTGKLVLADADGFVLEGEGLEDGGRRFTYEEVERARTVFEWPATSRISGIGHGEAKRHGGARRRRSTASGSAKDAQRVTTR